MLAEGLGGKFFQLLDCAAVTVYRIWPGDFISKLTKCKHSHVADKVKFIETDRNAPTQDYS